MNKIISMILLCVLLLVCFLGCSTPKAPADVNDPNDEIDSTPNDNENEKNPDNEIDSTPDNNESEKNPDNEIDPTPDDNQSEKNPANEVDPTPDDNEGEKEPDTEVDSTPDNNEGEKNPDNEIELPHHFHGEKDPANNNAGNNIDEAALKAIFEQLRADADANAKLEFWVEYEQIYYELKNSDEYDNCEWLESGFIVVVSCCYDCAANEDWYQQCSTTDIKSLNEAFYQQYGADITNGQYSNISFSSGMFLRYSSLDAFISDYDAIKALLELGYVKLIDIGYNYGLPICYFME